MKIQNKTQLCLTEQAKLDLDRKIQNSELRIAKYSSALGSEFASSLLRLSSLFPVQGP